MYIAMNRFKIKPGMGKQFEELWRKRNTYLDEVPGFRSFHLLRGPDSGHYILYASHSTWDNEAAFQAWTKSAAFRKAHANAGGGKSIYLDHPHFEGFEVVL